MSSESEMVREFMAAMGQTLPYKPGFPSGDVGAHRMGWFEEERIELYDALHARDLSAVADAIGDLLYVLHGTALAFGIDIDPVFAEIHRTNMEKRNGPVGPDGKRLKPPGWQPPDIRTLLIQQGAEL